MRKRIHLFPVILSVWMTAFMATSALAVPGVINYQGRLTDSGGAPVNVDKSIVFSIYTTASGGAAKWSQGRTVTVRDGAFSIDLGALSPIPAWLFDYDNIYLGVAVDGDPEMAPRQRLTSTGYSFRAASAENADLLNSMSSSEIIDAASDEVRIPVDHVPFTIMTSMSGKSFYFTGDLRHTDPNSHAIIVDAADVTIDMMGYTLYGTGKGTGDYSGIFITNRKNVELRNGTVRDFGYTGINSWTESDRRVINVNAIGNGNSGIYLSGYGQLIKDCTASENGYYGIYAQNSSTLSGNISHNNGWYGIGTATDCTITGNKSFDNATYGIYVSSGCTITGNTAANNSYSGIYAGTGCTVTGNNVYQNNESGIIAYDGCLVLNNTVRENNLVYSGQAAGIKTSYRCTVKGNTVSNNNLRNMLITNESNVVEDNHVTDSSGYGIYFSSTGNFYSNNRASGNATAGFAGNLPTGSGDGGGNVEF